jgi:hypothetical protein
MKSFQVYFGIFDCALLKNKLIVLYVLEDFKGKAPYKILQWFHSNSMATILEQTSKLANVVSAILATMASVK